MELTPRPIPRENEIPRSLLRGILFLPQKALSFQKLAHSINQVSKYFAYKNNFTEGV